MVFATVMVLAELLVVVDVGRAEGHKGYRTALEQLSRKGEHVGAYHYGIGGTSHVGIMDERAQGQRLATNGDVDNNGRVALHVSRHLTRLHRGLRADAIVLDERADLVATALPVAKAADTLQGIGQSLDDGQLGSRLKLFQGKLSACILLFVDTWLGHRCGNAESAEQRCNHHDFFHGKWMLCYGLNCHQSRRTSPFTRLKQR